MARRWFQFHLSTIIALVLVAGGLMGTNFIAHPVPEMYGDAYGFPLPMYQNWKGGEYSPGPGPNPFVNFKIVKYITIGGHEFYFNANGWSYTLLAIDLAAGCGILIVAAVCMEKFARAKQKEK